MVQNRLLYELSNGLSDLCFQFKKNFPCRMYLFRGFKKIITFLPKLKKNITKNLREFIEQSI